MRPADHWTRVVMYREAAVLLLNNMNVQDVEALEVSATDDSIWPSFPFKSYRTTPPYPDFDVCIGKYFFHRLDLVILDNVLEHVEHPGAAIENVIAMLKPGGHCFIATPFLIKIHPAPGDYWRWTPNGLRKFLMQSRFKKVTVGSWGNRDCVVANLGKGWTPYHPSLSLENNPECPVMVWALASL